MLGISALCLVLFSQLELFLIFFVLSSWTILIGSLYSWIFGVPSAMKMGYPQYPLINMNGLSSFPAMISNMLNYIMMWNVFLGDYITPISDKPNFQRRFWTWQTTHPIFSGDFRVDKLPIPALLRARARRREAPRQRRCPSSEVRTRCHAGRAGDVWRVLG